MLKLRDLDWQLGLDGKWYGGDSQLRLPLLAEHFPPLCIIGVSSRPAVAKRARVDIACARAAYDGTSFR